MSNTSASAPKGDSWPLLLRVWLWIQLVVVSWDSCFVLSRPYSFPDGPLGKFFIPFAKYMEVDKVYGDPTIPFGWATSTMCVFENLLLVIAMFILHPKEQKKATSHKFIQASDLLVMLACTIQWGKSVFYWLHDGYAGFAHVRHNPLPDLLAYFIIPNGIWLIAPLFVVNYFKNKILATTAAAEGKSK